MKKTTLLLIVLLNLTGLLLLASFKSPVLLPSLITYYTHLQGSSTVGFNDLDWYFLLQRNLLLLTFLVSVFFSVLTFYISSRRAAVTRPRMSFFFIGILFIALVGSFFVPAICSEGGCIDLGGILMLIFYVIFQAVFAFHISKLVQINKTFPMNSLILAASFLFLILFSYATASCGYSQSIQDSCHAEIADEFIIMDECSKISDSVIKQICTDQVQGRTEALNRYLGWRDNPLATINGRISECQSFRLDERHTSDSPNTIREGCYQALAREANSEIFTGLGIPCRAESIQTTEEENDFLQCIREFGKRDFMNEANRADLYKLICQELHGVQRENCLRVVG